MKNWTIGKRLTLGFAGIVLITVCVSIYAFTRLEAIQSQAAALANDSLPGAVLMGQIAVLSEREVALVLQHVKANDVQKLQKLDEALRENNEKLSVLFIAYKATVLDAEDNERFQRLNTTYSAYLTPLEEVLKLSRVQKDKEANDLYDQQLQPMFRKFLENINEYVEFNKKSAVTSVGKLNSAAGESKVVLMIGIVVSLIVAVLICYSVVRAINWLIAQVRRSALQVASSVTEIAATAETVNEGMQSQSTGAQQISEELAQLTESAQQTVDSLHQSSIVMDQLNSTANDLRTSVSQLGVQTA